MRNLFIHNRWFIFLTAIAVLFVVSFFIPLIWYVAWFFFITLALLSMVDILLLNNRSATISCERIAEERWDLGEENNIKIQLENRFPFQVFLELIEEIPDVFQNRDFSLKTRVKASEKYNLDYSLIPKERGELHFGNSNLFVSSPLQLFKKRKIFTHNTTIKVFPTTKILRNQQLLGEVEKNSSSGTRKLRKLGHSLEFEQIKDYVFGDDIRSINWKATARRNTFMVNSYTDIRLQQVYCIIDKGRSMKMPFEGMTLLEYALKAALTFTNVVLHKQDKAGLLTFSSKVNDILPADTGAKQRAKILETLYHQKTDFDDADYEQLLVSVHKKLTQRAFLMLFTNFESMAALERQLPYLRSLAMRHSVCVVFFENTAVRDIIEKQPETIEGIYTKTIATRFDYEKRLMIKALRRHGILAILTTPSRLSVDVVNQYLELKARQHL